MAHDQTAIRIIQDAIAAEVVRAGLAGVRALPESDEAVALSILDALEQNGLEVVRVRSSDA